MDFITVAKGYLKQEHVSHDFHKIMDVYLYEYNQAKFKYTQLLKKNLSHLSRKEKKALCDPNGYLPYRVFRSIEQEVKGLIQSQQTHRLNQLSNLEDKIKHTRQALKRLRTNFNNLKDQRINNPYIVKEELELKISKKRFSIIKKSEKLVRLQFRKNKLEKEVNNHLISICYGSRKRLKQRNQLHQNNQQAINQWKEQWHHHRYKELYFTGSSDEIMGNSNAHVILKDNQFHLKVVIPETLMKHLKVIQHFEGCQKRFVFELPIDFKHNDEYLKNHILTHQTLTKDERKGLKIPLGLRLLKRENGKGYDIHCSIHPQKKEINTYKEYGTIGVDINTDHLAVVETNERGNLVHHFNVALNLKDKTSHQRKENISLTIDQVINYAKEKGKSIVLEMLDFKKKKSELYKHKDTQYNEMLSSLSYGIIHELFTSKAFRHQIEIIKVNPAYTSFIGQYKYQHRYRLSIHESAALVIARRGMDIKEKMPSQWCRLKKHKKQQWQLAISESVKEEDCQKLFHFYKCVSRLNYSDNPPSNDVLLPTALSRRLNHKDTHKIVQQSLQSLSFAHVIYIPLRFSSFRV